MNHQDFDIAAVKLPYEITVSDKFVNKIGDVIQFNGFTDKPFKAKISDIKPGEDEGTLVMSLEAAE